MAALGPWFSAKEHMQARLQAQMQHPGSSSFATQWRNVVYDRISCVLCPLNRLGRCAREEQSWAFHDMYP